MNEKRYFKIFARINGKKNVNYLDLFNAIDEQDVHNEEELRKKFKGKKFVAQLSVTKNYLYQLILKSMVLYQQSTSIDGQIRELLSRAEFLHSKSLYKESEVVVDKVIRIAKKYEQHYFILEAFRLKRIIATSMYDFEKVKSAHEEEIRELELIENTRQFQVLTDKMIAESYLKGITQDKGTGAKILIVHPLLRKEKNAKTFFAKRRMYSFFYLYYYSEGMFEKAHLYSKKNADLYLTHPHMMEYDTYGYLNTLQTMIGGSILLGKISEAEFWIEKLKESEKYVRTQTQAVFLFSLSYHILNYYNSIGDSKSSIHYCEKNSEEKNLSRS